MNRDGAKTPPEPPEPMVVRVAEDLGSEQQRSISAPVQVPSAEVALLAVQQLLDMLVAHPDDLRQPEGHSSHDARHRAPAME